ncbi:uncharacterized protein G2W53_004656 [Senna tora]|uniref:Retrotransposon Copia-like N-terminal domain-containing protein n=1 Tax=Senna tora TaxID=362788 RepID=A0A834XDA0_9FABA|nr:uncharacterized protein G2W53_004656 [Senna tora]
MESVSSASSQSSQSSSAASSTQAQTCSLFSSSAQTASVKLDKYNYLLWESMVLPLIEGNIANVAQREDGETRNTSLNNNGSWRGGVRATRGGGRHGRGRQNNSNSGEGSIPYCHLCERAGLVAEANMAASLTEEDEKEYIKWHKKLGH